MILVRSLDYRYTTADHCVDFMLNTSNGTIALVLSAYLLPSFIDCSGISGGISK